MKEPTNLNNTWKDSRQLKLMKKELKNIANKKLLEKLENYILNNGNNGSYLENIFNPEELQELQELQEQYFLLTI